jgi:hypothetical protein
MSSSNIDPNSSLVLVNTTSSSKTLYLPSTNAIYGKQMYIKDSGGYAGTNNITVRVIGTDLFEDGTTSQLISINYGVLNVVANRGRWSLLGNNSGSGALVFTPQFVTF